MAALNRFVILSHGRTGSTALCRAMQWHPDVHAHEEVFHDSRASREIINGRIYEDGMNTEAFCREHVFREPHETGKRTVGFKIFFFHCRGTAEEYSVWPYLIESRDIRVILLLRRNIFDAYVSEQRSRRSGTWYLEPGETVSIEHVSPIFIDPVSCRAYMDRTAAEIEWGRRAFAEHSILTVYYEDLLADFQATLDRIFSFLGESPVSVPLTFTKLNTAPHCQGVMNYPELERWFRLSIFRDCFMADQFEKPGVESDMKEAACPKG